MDFDFLIAYRDAKEIDISRLLVELLGKVLEDNLNDLEPETLEQMIRLKHERAGEESSDDNGKVSRYMLLGFTLELSEEIEQKETVVEEFAAALAETPPIFHAVKFEDPILRSELARRGEELFVLEMKLRRALTFIYLHANQESDPYDLLREETVQPMAKEKPKQDQMKAAAENQFFHLTFGQYLDLNQRPDIRQMGGLLDVIRDSATYDAFRSEVSRAPVEQVDDAGFLAGLKERMDAIEKMRNCVAHNRRPSRRVAENYENVRPLLDQLLDDYLARWERVVAAAPSAPAAPEMLAAETPIPGVAAPEAANVEADGSAGTSNNADPQIPEGTNK